MCATNGGATARSLDNRCYWMPESGCTTNGGAASRSLNNRRQIPIPKGRTIAYPGRSADLAELFSFQ